MKTNNNNDVPTFVRVSRYNGSSNFIVTSYVVWSAKLKTSFKVNAFLTTLLTSGRTVVCKELHYKLIGIQNV